MFFEIKPINRIKGGGDTPHPSSKGEGDTEIQWGEYSDSETHAMG